MKYCGQGAYFLGLIARCYAVKHPPALKFIVWITMPRHDSRKKWAWRVGDVPITTAKATLTLESRGKNPSPIKYSWETRVYPGGKK